MKRVEGLEKTKVEGGLIGTLSSLVNPTGAREQCDIIY